MDTKISFYKFKYLVCEAKDKYLHFNRLYQDKLEEFHNTEHIYEIAKEYTHTHDDETSSDYVRSLKDMRKAKDKLRFSQDELTMYKHEMMKWREISSRLEKAYSTLYKQIGHFLNVENIGEPEMFRSYGTGKTILLTNHYFGHGIMLHLIIVSYNYTNSK